MDLLDVDGEFEKSREGLFVESNHAVLSALLCARLNGSSTEHEEDERVEELTSCNLRPPFARSGRKLDHARQERI